MAKQSKSKKNQPKDHAKGAAAPADQGKLEARPRRHVAWVALLALAVLAYLPALRAGFIWDDQPVWKNPMMKGLGGLMDFWVNPTLNAQEHHYWPLVYTTFWLEHLFFGLKPLVFHLDNILLHGVCVILLWRVLRHLEVPGAWLGAALFAVHPVHVESVAWIIERKDVLSGALYLGAALAYLKFDEHRSHKSYGTYYLALVLFTLAMLSKSIVVTLPVALGIAVWWRRGRLGWRDVAPLIPLAFIAMVMTLADMMYLKDVPSDDMIQLTLSQRIQIAGRALWFYAGKLVWPHPLVSLYPKWDIPAGGLTGWLPLAGAVALAGGLWVLRRRLGRGPAAATLYYGITLAPVLGVISFSFIQAAWVADRFQYLASIGPLVLLAGGLTRLGMRNVDCGMINPKSSIRNPQSAILIPVSVLLAILGVLTFRQAARYHDSVTLFRHNVAVHPGNWIPHLYLGTAYEDAGRVEEAAAAYAEALRLKPDGSYRVPYKLALVQARLGRSQEAEQSFQTGVAMNPNYAEGRNSFGIFLADQGRVEEAVAEYREALRVRPEYAEALNNMGNLMLRTKRYDAAAELFGKAVALSPQSAICHSNLAMALLQAGKTDEAMVHLREAVRLDANQFIARVELGMALLQRGALDEAIQHLEIGARQQPQDAFIRTRLGTAYQQKGRIQDAIGQFSEALRLRPGYPEAAARLAQCQPAQ